MGVGRVIAAIIIVLLLVFVGYAAYKELPGLLGNLRKDDSSTFVPVSIASVVSNSSLDSVFQNYGNSGNGWTGGDGTYSVQLPNGTILWIFSDTFLGKVANGTRVQSETQFIHNSIVEYKNGKLIRTITGGDASNPVPVFSPVNSSHWYWPGFAVIHNDTIQVMLSEFEKMGSGILGFKEIGISVGVLSIQTLSLQNIYKLNFSAGISWTSSSFGMGGYTYIFGYKGSSAYAARTSDGLLGQWQYYSNGNWSYNQSTASPFAGNVEPSYSIVKVGNYYVLETMNDTNFLAGQILYYYATSLLGPYTYGGIIYTTPEQQYYQPAIDYQIITYDSLFQREFTSNNTYVISYNVNGNGTKAITNASVYRPRFIDVTFNVS